ncbi:hypothetical protein HanXRQr2_Chr09g0378741 [Helianthus annuus]|uniref:Uncharacterized protein n=1 Tax=Helianthus annuus TaxID=4232 RepID=A0A9K3N7M1_HELAN|nr:hypothetical protein HanXRQr2_Chr09g0378741 [Helianthus annuus]KAJ0959429.1 hypothetical protein HanPSC8_Chr00c100g0804581 [Helianthus annuus]
MVKKNVIVTISSDCGGINSTSVKISRALHKIINSGMIPNRNFSVDLTRSIIRLYFSHFLILCMSGH